MSKKSEREWDKLQEEVKKNQLERLKKKEKELQNDERPELRETASQIATKKWIEEGGEESTLKTKFEGRTEQFFDAVDELFDELMARTMTIFEALGIVTEGDWSPPKGSEKDKAIRRMVKDVVRDIQNRVKDEYPNYKDLK